MIDSDNQSSTMETPDNVRKCLLNHCSNEVTGRSDKRFCSTKCKARYNNRRKQEEETAINSQIQTFRKNCKIVESAHQRCSPIPIPVEALKALGFSHIGLLERLKGKESGKSAFRFGDFVLIPNEQTQTYTIKPYEYFK